MEFLFETTPQRSDLMKKIKSTNTKYEDLLAKELWKNGIRYRRNYSKVPGKPDIAITKYKIAIFIDGEFWHGYNWGQKKDKIKANRDYWIPKIEKTIKRDEENNIALNCLGWKVFRFWEQQLKKDFENCVITILTLVQKSNIS